MTIAGRYAPSPSGDLHVGNLRTALLAWLFARSTDRAFWMRVEDLDRVREGAAERQLEDLAALGLDWDGRPVRQSQRRELYAAAIERLAAEGRTFECFCTRREILDAPTAPHLPPGAYPGTCRTLTEQERAARRRERPPAIRLRSEVDEWSVTDALHGTVTASVDDLVLRRNDGIPAYNLAVVVDDGAQGIDQVVRGDDLLTSAPRQAYLASLLGIEPPEYAHVPLALNLEGKRLAKRDGAVTYRELTARGIDVFDLIAASLGLVGDSPQALLDGFDPSQLPREPWTFVPPAPA
ncbi:tRNA glutamyl-Q(34) synthetase GluQRS [Aeromicrobium phragmitis]|uniref:Glutamyl-Q tRNA(Asp) synthetase n=1 Tax=Aeromicrobium phragmitis TaxID=2478914 RepID=A0A3L8PLV4_9ACTN|nr:tRNA glutamyl-Q(34) synthetase GluQRS [Aeromicrobium phragmitis]RLV54992.1 tRNA glutamyl-Q(34) synthetase GluQRS [Aeromicrobium phragmitis]